MKSFPYLVLIVFMMLSAITEEIYTTKEQEIRIKKADIEIKQAKIEDLEDIYYPEIIYSYIPPLYDGEFLKISSYFGLRDNPLRENTGGSHIKNHPALDIVGLSGARVRSLAAGIVLEKWYEAGLHYVGGEWREYSGHPEFNGYIRILHDDGRIVKYGHVFEILVHEQERVEAGQDLCKINPVADKNSTGPHLHLSIQEADKTYVNPLKFVEM